MAKLHFDHPHSLFDGVAECKHPNIDESKNQNIVELNIFALYKLLNAKMNMNIIRVELEHDCISTILFCISPYNPGCYNRKMRRYLICKLENIHDIDTFLILLRA